MSTWGADEEGARSRRAAAGRCRRGARPPAGASPGRHAPLVVQHPRGSLLFDTGFGSTVDRRARTRRPRLRAPAQVPGVDRLTEAPKTVTVTERRVGRGDRR